MSTNDVTTGDDLIDVTTIDSNPSHHGATDKMFVQVAILLAAVTAVEVAWSYLPWGDGAAMTVLEVGGLLAMMGFKFYMVASVFMHLKWDSKLLTGFFYFGLGLAVAVYLAVLFVFEFFSSGYS
ncbi:MAG: cytochrome C oxidase subunit IV family protein [Acidimicrobiales bacterium]|nr:cytochrome C oxidase subunit IV family protein [Acidimicrobiales bacterium]